MKFFKNIVKKKSNDNLENRTTGTILGCGRDMGRVTSGNAEGRNYAVGSVVDLVHLTEKEYKIWRQLRRSRTLEEWKKNCLYNKLISNDSQLDEIKELFIEHHLIVFEEFDSPEADILSNYTISKNGMSVGFSEEQNKWLIMSHIPKKSVGLTEEQYHMWRAASGVSTMRAIIAKYRDISNSNQQDPLKLFNQLVFTFNKTGLWNIEYCGDVDKLIATSSRKEKTFNKYWFNPDSIKTDSLLISIGEDAGAADTGGKIKDHMEIIVGRESFVIPYDEYLVWLACRKPNATVANLAELFKLDQEVVIKDYLVKMFAKRLLMIWPSKWTGDEEDIISTTSRGIGVGTKDKVKFDIIDITNGPVQTISPQAYIIWVFSHGYFPLRLVAESIKNLFNCSDEQAQQEISKWVPYLISNGLLNLQLIPSK